MKNWLPITITIFVATIAFTGVFSGLPPLMGILRLGMFWMVIIGGVASALGAVNLFQIHSVKVMRKEGGSVYSVILIIVMLATIFIGIYMTPQSVVYSFLFEFVFTPLTTAIFSILAFFIASACFRAFRVRTAEALVLVVSATLVMLGKSTLGEQISPYIPIVGEWVMDVPNSAGSRGILLGASLGGIAVFLRVILGIERGHFLG
ncbi:MAG: hypothetical protein ACUVWP_01145 [bacterium]